MQSATTHHENSAGQKKPVFWIFVAALIGLGLFFGMNSLFLGKSNSTLDPEDPARDAERVKNLADLKAENEIKLNTYAWIDQPKGSIQIPIAEAMTLVIADLNAKKPAAAYPVLDSTGKPLPASTPASSPAADAADNLPSEPTAASQTSSNVLAAPVESGSAKPAKTKKQANQ
ncbi:MAG: hypothetical protein NTZ08_08585 [Verrucomicrobia bacterium]|jgi:hypothetical protein|nr:hypothetical protein [Verrucomicrobiota bacterium]